MGCGGQTEGRRQLHQLHRRGGGAGALGQEVLQQRLTKEEEEERKRVTNVTEAGLEQHTHTYQLRLACRFQRQEAETPDNKINNAATEHPLGRYPHTTQHLRGDSVLGLEELHHFPTDGQTQTRHG